MASRSVRWISPAADQTCFFSFFINLFAQTNSVARTARPQGDDQDCRPGQYNHGKTDQQQGEADNRREDSLDATDRLFHILFSAGLAARPWDEEPQTGHCSAAMVFHSCHWLYRAIGDILIFRCEMP